jgi:hypothetical protein
VAVAVEPPSSTMNSTVVAVTVAYLSERRRPHFYLPVVYFANARIARKLRGEHRSGRSSRS